MKIALLLIFAIIPCLVLATDQYVLKKNRPGCYVKAYKNREFEDVPYKRFQNLKIIARPHNKLPNFMLFKVNDQLYVTKYSCLEDYEFTDVGDDLPDSGEEENLDRLNRTIKPVYFEGLKFNEKKYFFALDYGILGISDKNSTMDYEKVLNGYVNDPAGNPVTFTNPSGTDYKTGNLLSLAFGWRVNDLRFYSVKIKRYSGKKSEPVSFQSSAIPSGTMHFSYEDTFSSLLFGNKFIFLENSSFKPYISAHIGLSLIQSKLSIPEAETGTKFLFDSSGIAAEIESGFEILFTEHLGVGVRVGYEYLGTRTFRFKQSAQSDPSDQGFRTPMSYSNFYGSSGLIVYF